MTDTQKLDEIIEEMRRDIVEIVLTPRTERRLRDWADRLYALKTKQPVENDPRSRQRRPGHLESELDAAQADLSRTEAWLDSAACDMPEGTSTNYPTVAAYAQSMVAGYRGLLLQARQLPVPQSSAEFALRALVAAGHVSQEKVDQALRLPGAPAQPAADEPVAYLDLGAGGYIDLGSDLADEQLAALPKGRHMLGIIGTYGVDGYKATRPQPAPSAPISEDAIIAAFSAAGMNCDMDQMENRLYSVRGQLAQLINGARQLLAAAPEAPR